MTLLKVIVLSNDEIFNGLIHYVGLLFVLEIIKYKKL